MESLPALKRAHARRLRDVYRSAGWPYQDLVELELMAAGLLEHVVEPSGHTIVRLTSAGVQHVAQSAQQNRQAMSAHDSLVERVVRMAFSCLPPSDVNITGTSQSVPALSKMSRSIE